jgi:hypothetical protein
VRGEDALLADGVDVGFGCVFERSAGETVFEEREGKESSVALVHVIDDRLAGEGVKQGDAAEAEDRLLTEAVVGVAAIEVVGEAAIPGVVAFDIGVKQEDGDDMSSNADDVEAPGTDEDLTVLQRKGDDLVGAGKGCFRRPGNVGLGLLPDIGELLAKVAAAMDQRDRDHRTAGVGGGAQSVASEHAEATGVRRKRRGEGYLHGEVGDGASAEIRCGGGESGGKIHAWVVPFLIRADVGGTATVSIPMMLSIGEVRALASFAG